MDKQSKIACLGAHHIRCAEHAIGLDYHKNKPYIRHGKKFYRPYMHIKSQEEAIKAWNRRV